MALELRIALCETFTEPVDPATFATRSWLGWVEMQEVYSVSQSLTDDQKRIADCWADGAGTVTPAGHWNAIAVDLVKGADFLDAPNEAAVSRLGGIHYRSDNTVGLALGRRVGQVALRAYHVSGG